MDILMEILKLDYQSALKLLSFLMWFIGFGVFIGHCLWIVFDTTCEALWKIVCFAFRFIRKLIKRIWKK